MDRFKKQKLIAIGGPTAIGKSGLGICLAKELGAEIISADSMQVYCHMDIGTAKVKKEEMQGVRHHLLDVVQPWDSFDVFEYQKLAKKALQQIYDQGKIPIVVGGTGFYIQALLYDIDFTTADDGGEIRKELTALLEEKGSSYLHGLLSAIDAESAAAIHPNNGRRILRAIEFFRLSGEKLSMHNKAQQARMSPYEVHFFVLTDARERIYARIDKRVDRMIEEGYLEEVERLLTLGAKPADKSMQGLGYKEMAQAVLGHCTLETAVSLTKQQTRHYAKRQGTWFRRERDVIWYDKSNPQMEDALILEDMITRISTSEVSEIQTKRKGDVAWKS